MANYTSLETHLTKIGQANQIKLINPEILEGVNSYLNFKGLNDEINNSRIIVNKFGSTILDNQEVYKLLIGSIDDRIIEELADLLNLKAASIIGKRNALMKMRVRSKAVHASLISVLNLDPAKYKQESKPIELISKDSGVPDYSMHDYQKRIKDQAAHLLLNTKYKEAKLLIHMPTGSGKTKTAMELIADYLRVHSISGGYDNRFCVIWFAHSAELCDQAFDSFRQTWKLRGDVQVPVYKLYGNHPYPNELLTEDRAIVFLGFQKFNSVLKQIQKTSKGMEAKIGLFLKERCKLVVVDEAHKSLAQTYERAIEFFTGNPGTQLVGLTATPGRSADVDDPNNKHLASFFDSRLIRMADKLGKAITKPLSYLQDMGVLAKVERIPLNSGTTIKVDEKSWVNLRREGEFSKSTINHIAKHALRNDKIIDEVLHNVQENKKTLVFACNINHCILLQTLLQLNNVRSECVLGETDSSSRIKHIEEFKSGNLLVLINYGVLTTGFDAPKLNTLIIARPTASIVLYSQMIGRALRGPLNGGNSENRIVDLIDNYNVMGKESHMFRYFDELWFEE